MRNHRATMRLSCLLGLPLLLTLPLVGCGGGGTNGGGSGSSPSPAPAAPLSVSSTLPDGLTATLAEDKAAVPVGGSVVYTLTLTNDTSQPVTFTPYYATSEFSSAPIHPVGGYLSVTSPTGAAAYPLYPTGTTSSGGTVGTGPATTLTPAQSVSGTFSPGAIFPTSGAYAATAEFGFYPPATSAPSVGPLTVTAQ